MKPSDRPYLTIVATSRNDDHGGDPLRRNQIFLNALCEQCERFQLPAEVLLVDWNPPADRPGLDAALSWEKCNDYISGRVIRVPAEVHDHHDHAAKLPLFQMIAKNVGIRRAKGEFVLATNIDILFSDELIQFLAKQDLDPERMYRVDRYDTDNGIPIDAPLAEQLEYGWEQIIRVHQTGKTVTDPKPVDRSAPLPEPELLSPYVEPHEVHTNACGDFTLLSKDAWFRLRGYPEWEIYSFHIDSVLCLTAHYGGIRQIFLPPPYACFHIEHSMGSGWTPEGGEKLFERMRKAGIPCMEYQTLLHACQRTRDSGVAELFNEEHWGFGHLPTRSVAGAINAVEEVTLEGAELERPRVTAYRKSRSDVVLHGERSVFLEARERELLEHQERLQTELRQCTQVWREREEHMRRLTEEIQRRKDLPPDPPEAGLFPRTQEPDSRRQAN